MAQRIQMMRQLLFQKLKALGTPGTWDHLVQQSGLFAFTGLSGNLLVSFMYDLHFNHTIFVLDYLNFMLPQSFV